MFGVLIETVLKRSTPNILFWLRNEKIIFSLAVRTGLHEIATNWYILWFLTKYIVQPNFDVTSILESYTHLTSYAPFWSESVLFAI